MFTFIGWQHRGKQNTSMYILHELLPRLCNSMGEVTNERKKLQGEWISSKSRLVNKYTHTAAHLYVHITLIYHRYGQQWGFHEREKNTTTNKNTGNEFEIIKKTKKNTPSQVCMYQYIFFMKSQQTIDYHTDKKKHTWKD